MKASLLTQASQKVRIIAASEGFAGRAVGRLRENAERHTSENRGWRVLTSVPFSRSVLRDQHPPPSREELMSRYQEPHTVYVVKGEGAPYDFSSAPQLMDDDEFSREDLRAKIGIREKDL